MPLSHESVPMPPTPSFADLGVPADLVAVLSAASITAPFPIQTLTVPDVLAGRDVCGRAPTGSGKTLAFGLGVVARLHGPRSSPRRPRVLVLTPTRELASQVAAELRAVAAPRKLQVEAVYGGVGYGPQRRALARGVDVAVACPGRLADLIQQGDVHLDAVETVVIDEADRMADMGFLPEVRRILDRTPGDRQTILFSATLDGAVDVLVRHYQRDPARHELEESGDDAPDARHLFWRVTSGERVARAAEVVAAAGPTIVFTRTKHGADRVARQLGERGVRAAAIHGDRSQRQRERALEAFGSGAVDALVATDVAARGIHVDGVAAVVHVDPPADSKDYVHRSGRTARAGASGVVVSLVTPDKAGAVRQLQRSLGLPSGTTPSDLAAVTEVTGTPLPRRRPAPVAGAAEPERARGRDSGRPVRGKGRGRPSTSHAARTGSGSTTGKAGRSRSATTGRSGEPGRSGRGQPAVAGRGRARRGARSAAGR